MNGNRFSNYNDLFLKAARVRHNDGPMLNSDAVFISQALDVNIYFRIPD